MKIWKSRAGQEAEQSCLRSSGFWSSLLLVPAKTPPSPTQPCCRWFDLFEGTAGLQRAAPSRRVLTPYVSTGLPTRVRPQLQLCMDHGWLCPQHRHPGTNTAQCQKAKVCSVLLTSTLEPGLQHHCRSQKLFRQQFPNVKHCYGGCPEPAYAWTRLAESFTMVMDMFILFKNMRLLLCENTSSLWIQRLYCFEFYLLYFIIIIF